MQKFIFFSIMIILLSCSKEEVIDKELEPEMEVPSEDCGVMNPIGFSASPLDASVLLHFGSIGHWDGPFVSCSPEAYSLFMSEDGNEFEKLITVTGNSGSHLVDNLENGKIYFFRATATHSQLEPTESQVRMVKVGLLSLPSFINNPLTTNFELFSLGPDGDKFLYRTSSDNWYVTSFSNPIQGVKVVDDSFSAKWNPYNENEITYRGKQYVEIASNTNGVTSKSLTAVNLPDGSENTLHQINEFMDFGSEFKPEQYWIHDFNYSLDATSIYYKSNKDNGSSTLTEKKVFNNIWKLNLVTKQIEQISDFLPINFELNSFVEDPKSPNNFYVLGGTNGEVVEIDGAIFNPDQVDVYYYNSTDQSLNLIFETIYEENFLDINPSGNKLLVINASSGKDELWSFDLVSKSLSQITQSNTYRHNKYRYYPNWISDTEFMVSLIHEDDLKLAVFKI